MYKLTSLTFSFVYGMGLQTPSINQLVKPITLYFYICDPQTFKPTIRGVDFAIKTLHALGSLKHMSFVIVALKITYVIKHNRTHHSDIQIE
jgi:hypothetical protein